MEYYEKNLGDVGEPQRPSERNRVQSCQVHDYEALWLRCALLDYAYYGTDANTEVALSLSEYIGEKVHEQQEMSFDLYLKTDYAVQTVLDAIAHQRTMTKEVDAMMCKTLERRVTALQS